LRHGCGRAGQYLATRHQGALSFPRMPLPRRLPLSTRRFHRHPRALRRSATSDWALTPTVWVSICTTAFNMLARLAFHDGARIAWWYKALRGGSVGDLSTRWVHADGFWAALLSPPSQMSFVSLASVAVTVLVVDQPLMQGVSTVVSTQRTSSVPVRFAIATELPWGFTGYQNGRGTEEQVMTQPMVAAYNAFNSQAPMSSGWQGCNGTCTGFVDAAGLAARCNSTTGPVAFNMTKPNVAWTPFGVDFVLAEGESEKLASQIIMSLTFTSGTSDCQGLHRRMDRSDPAHSDLAQHHGLPAVALRRELPVP
jgi:hypothetical protein